MCSEFIVIFLLSFFRDIKKMYSIKTNKEIQSKNEIILCCLMEKKVSMTSSMNSQLIGFASNTKSTDSADDAKLLLIFFYK